MDGVRDGGVMWGLHSPTPRGRTESCTLHILTDVLTGAHGKACMWIQKPQNTQNTQKGRCAQDGGI